MTDLIERLREVARIHDRTDFIVSAVCTEAADALEAYATCPDAINALQGLVRDQKAALEAAREESDRWRDRYRAAIDQARGKGGVR